MASRYWIAVAHRHCLPSSGIIQFFTPKRRFLLSVVCLLLAFLLGCGNAAPPATPTPTLDPQVAQGKALFSQRCASCHAIEPDTVIVGPSLAGIAGEAAQRMDAYNAEQYILLSITKPDVYLVEGFTDQMPSTLGKDLTGEELDALVAYLLTLE